MKKKVNMLFHYNTCVHTCTHNQRNGKTMYSHIDLCQYCWHKEKRFFCNGMRVTYKKK